jgi:heat shock protein HslJ
MRIILMLVALSSLAVAALTPAGGAESGGLGENAAASASLTGKVWVLTALRGKTPLRGTELTSEFKAGKVDGSSGCNQYSGTYTSSGNTIRVSSQLASTQKACARAIELQEAAFLKALPAARTYRINGTKLTLFSAAGAALLTYRAQTQQLPGTSWTVLAYNNGTQAVVSVLAGTKLTAVFGKDGTIAGSAGCNDYNGPVKASAPKISIGPLASTRKFCADPDGVMDQESQYLAALETAATYRVQGSRMEMRTTDGALVAQFQRR